MTAASLRDLEFVPGQFYEVTWCAPGGPVGRAAKRGDGRFAAYRTDDEAAKQMFDTFDDAVRAARSLIGDPR